MKLAVTGVPRYDALRRMRAAGPKSAGRHVLFCASIAVPYEWAAATSISSLLGQRGFSREYFMMYVRDLVRLACEDPGMRLTLKPHYEEPGLWKEVWDKIPLELRSRVRIAKAGDDIFKLESEASLIVTQASSVVCEAVALDKPVILLNYPEDDITKPFTDRGVAKEATNYAGLKAAAESLLSGGPENARMAEARARSRKELIGEFDGNNSRRAARWIRNAWLKH
jgi:UDP-N-acetylglucosamine 2-epimerase